MEKTLEIASKTYKARELTYLEVIELLDLPKKEQVRKQLALSLGLTDDEINKLSFKDGLMLQKLVNDVNSLENFQTPAGTE